MKSFWWIAVRGKSATEVRRELGFQGSGVWLGEPDCPLAGAILSTGWYLVRAAGMRDVLRDIAVPYRLSRRCEVVTCRADAAESVSAAGEWQNGQRIWFVRHDGRRGQNDIETFGTLPLGFESIKTDWLGQGEGDPDLLFEVAIDIAEAMTGYRDGGSRTTLTKRGFELLIAGGVRERGRDSVGQWFKRLLGSK